MKRYRTGEDRELDAVDRALSRHQRRDRLDGSATEMDDLVAIPFQCARHQRREVVYVDFRRLVHGGEWRRCGMAS